MEIKSKREGNSCHSFSGLIGLTVWKLKVVQTLIIYLFD